MSQLFNVPYNPVVGATGLILDGAKWYFYLTGTTTPATVYTTAALAVAHSNPVEADALGRFDPIFLDPSIQYRAVLKTSSGVAVPDCDFDPVNDVLEAVSVVNFGAVSGGSVVAAVTAALTSLGTSVAAALVFPKGTWVVGANVDWSAYRNITFILEPGCIFSHSTFNITFPERIETRLGVSFVGSGTVKGKNKDEVALSPPPGGWLTYPNSTAGGLNNLRALTTGTNNFAWGANALAACTKGRSNFAWGNDALKSVVGTDTVPVGTVGTYGSWNVAIGDTVFRDLTTGFENVCIGGISGQQLTTGQWNVIVGHASQITGTTASNNIAIGAYVLTTNNGNNNIGIGWAALEVQATGSNIAIGHTAMNANVTGTRNVVIGADSLIAGTAANENVAVGTNTLPNLINGSNNVAIGNDALGTLAGAGTNNTAVGRNALLLATGDGNTAVGSGAGNLLTTETNTTAIGLSAAPTASNQVTLGNGAVTELRAPGPGFKASLTDFTLNKTSTAAGTTGAQTIQKPAGAVNFAIGATSLVVTNALVTANSIIIATVATNDATMKTVLVVAGAGSFTIHANAAATAETRVNYLVIN